MRWIRPSFADGGPLTVVGHVLLMILHVHITSSDPATRASTLQNFR